MLLSYPIKKIDDLKRPNSTTFQVMQDAPLLQVYALDQQIPSHPVLRLIEHALTDAVLYSKYYFIRFKTL